MQKLIANLNEAIEFLKVLLKTLLYLIPVAYLLNLFLGKKFEFLNELGSEIKSLLKLGSSSIELLIALILLTYVVKK
ncbi:MAG: hypothetical protein OEZ13_02125 [Spirochaetia bacterium]|nr:hypothetical protein [Spirochaetia bacterium]